MTNTPKMSAQSIFTQNFNRLMKQKMKDEQKTRKKIDLENGLNESTVSLWTKGSRFPSDENLDRLCEIFNVPLSEFFIEPGKSKEIDNVLPTTPIVGNDLHIAQLQESINTLLSIGKKDYIVNFLTDRLAPIVLPNDSLLCTAPSALDEGCTVLCLFGHQFAICSVKSEGTKFIFTNLNDPSQTWQLDPSAAPSSVLGIVLKLSRDF